MKLGDKWKEEEPQYIWHPSLTAFRIVKSVANEVVDASIYWEKISAKDKTKRQWKISETVISWETVKLAQKKNAFKKQK